MRRIVLIPALALVCLATPCQALTVDQFLTICAETDRPCTEVPILQAYVGGSLDFVAVLHEQTDYVRPIYCKDTALLFNVSAIIRYIEEHGEGNRRLNAMVMVVRYLEEFGGCTE